MDELLQFLKIAVWTAGAVAAVFTVTHAVARKSLNVRLARSIREFNLGDWISGWPREFIRVFDSVFGRRFISWRFFLSSCCASLSALFVLYVAFFLILDVSLSEYLDTFPQGTMALGLIKIAVGNLLPDYLSLIETRYLLGRLGDRPKPRKVLLCLVLDFIATITIFALIFPTFTFLNIVALGHVPFELGQFVSAYETVTPIIFGYLLFPTLDIGSSYLFEDLIQFWTTFFTSVWLWLFGLALLIATAGERFGGPVWLWLRDRILDFDEKPILSLGWLASAVTLVGFMIALPFRML